MNLIENKISDCFDPCICSMVDIEQLILESKVAETGFGKNLKDDLFHGWTCDIDAEDKIDKLQTYKNQLEIEYLCRSMGGKSCLSCEELQLLYEKTKKFTITCEPIKRPDLVLSKNNLELWIAQNPYCVSREKWEYLVYDILCDLNLDVKIINNNDACNIVLDIIKEEISCDIMATIDVVKNNCDIGLEVIRKNEKQCKIDLNILRKDKSCKIGLDLHVKKFNCEIDLKHYTRLIDSNLSLGAISCVYKNGACLSVEKQFEDAGEVMLYTTDNVYSFNSIQFLDSPDIQALTKYGVSAQGKYVENPKLFIQNLNKDYNG